MAISPILQNFKAGLEIGEDLGNAFAERNEAKAYSALKGYQPGGEAQGEGGEQLPSTRDWITLRENYLRAAARRGPEAIDEANEKIDEMERKGFVENLSLAKIAMQQGNMAAAQRYIRMGQAYRPDFQAIELGTGRNPDGSEALTGYTYDEQTSQQTSPGMVITPDVLDHFLEMAADPVKWASGLSDRQMAMDKFRLEQEKFGAQREEREWRRGYDVGKVKYTTEAGLNKQRGKDIPSEKDFRKVGTDYLKTLESDERFDTTSGTFIPARTIPDADKREFMRLFDQAIKNPSVRESMSPSEVASMILQKMGYE